MKMRGEIENMITEEIMNEKLDNDTKSIIVEATIKELINPGTSVPGGLISYRHREKTAVVKVKGGEGYGVVTPSSGFATIDQLFTELSDALKMHGKAYYPLQSRFRNSTLYGCNTLTIVCEGKPVFEITLTLDPFKETFLQMDPKKIPSEKDFLPLAQEEMEFIKKVQPWTKHNADLAFHGNCSWTKFEYITRDCIPLESRVVVSNRKLVSEVVMSQANLIIAI